MPDQVIQPPLLDLARHLRDQHRRHVLQHHRLQRKASRLLAPLDERTALQGVQGFEQLHLRQRRDQYREQRIDAHRLAHNRQPTQHALLKFGEPRKLHCTGLKEKSILDNGMYLSEQFIETTTTRQAVTEVPACGKYERS